MSKTTKCPKCGRELYLDSEDEVIANCPHCGASLDGTPEPRTPIVITILRILVPVVIVALFFSALSQLLGGPGPVIFLLVVLIIWFVTADAVSMVNNAAIDCVMEALTIRGVAPVSAFYKKVLSFLLKILCYGTCGILLCLEMLIVVVWTRKSSHELGVAAS